MKMVRLACVLVLLLSALGLSGACSGSPTATAGAPHAAGVLSLDTRMWDTLSEPEGFPLSNNAAGHLVFEFPATGSINYLINVKPPTVISGTIVVSLRISTTGPVVFNYMMEPSNTCPTPATVRPLIWAHGNSPHEFDRWWSNPTSWLLTAGSGTLIVPLSPEKWSSVYGRLGNASAAARAGFTNALRNVSSLGLTFGGGCFFGHGVNVRGGSAQFVLTNYQIQ